MLAKKFLVMPVTDLWV